MSVLAVKRRKLSDNKESSLSEEENGNSSNKELKSTNAIDEEAKSDLEGEGESQENQRSSRVSGFGRRRKKKVFADYYCDEIFSKPKNGNKKQPKIKKKQTKAKEKTKPNKKELTEESRKSLSKNQPKKLVKVASSNVNQALPHLSMKGAGAFAQKKVQRHHSFKGLELSNKNHEIQKLASGLNNFGILNNTNMADAKNYPIKPIPQRQGSSNLDLLLNAYRMSNPSQASQGSKIDENLKKREDKAIDKQVQKLLSNSESPLINGASPFGMGSMQDTINAILKRTSSSSSATLGPQAAGLHPHYSEERRSSSEIDENLKPRTPVKVRASKVNEREGYSSPEEARPQDSAFHHNRGKPFVMKTPKKLRNKPRLTQENAERTSRVQRTIKTSDGVRLILGDNNGGENQSINLSLGDRSLTAGIDLSNACPNLNKLFGIISSGDSIVENAREKMSLKLKSNIEKSIHGTAGGENNCYRLNSMPMLFSLIKKDN